MLIGIDASRANHKQRTGVEEYAFQLVQHLKEITPDNVRVVLYSDQKLQGELAKLPVNWEEKVLKWFPRRFWTQVRLSWEMFFHAPDVLFIPAHVFPLIHPKKTIMTVHDIAAIKFPESYNWFERWYSVWSARYAVNKLWRVIAPSEFTMKELVSLQVSKFVSDKIRVIYHGYDERFKIQDSRLKISEVLKKYNLTKPYLLSVGRLEEKKNTVRIIEAFNLLKNRNHPIIQSSNHQLVLVGQPGFGYNKVREAINNSPYKNDIILPGWVSDEDLPDIMSGAEVFVFPSLYEGFGLPILEAMASGVPVVASGGASQEVGGEACVYVDPLKVNEIGEGVLKILENADFRMQNIEKGLERVKKFSWGRCAEETGRLFY